MSTWQAVLVTALLAATVGGAIWFWASGVVRVAERPDWNRYVNAVLDGDESAVQSMVCAEIRHDLDKGQQDFVSARAATIAAFSSPPVRYEGLKRGGHLFTLHDGSTVFHAIPSVSEGGGDRKPCPPSSTALLGSIRQ